MTSWPYLIDISDAMFDIVRPLFHHWIKSDHNSDSSDNLKPWNTVQFCLQLRRAYVLCFPCRIIPRIHIVFLSEIVLASRSAFTWSKYELEPRNNELCSKLIITAAKWRRDLILMSFFVYFEQISHIILWCFNYWLLASKFRLGLWQENAHNFAAKKVLIFLGNVL